MLSAGADLDVVQLIPQVGTIENRTAPCRADVARVDQIALRVDAHVSHHGEEELEGQSSAVGDGREEQAREPFMSWRNTAVRGLESLGRLVLAVLRIVHHSGGVVLQLSVVHAAG